MAHQLVGLLRTAKELEEEFGSDGGDNEEGDDFDDTSGDDDEW